MWSQDRLHTEATTHAAPCRTPFWLVARAWESWKNIGTESTAVRVFVPAFMAPSLTSREGRLSAAHLERAAAFPTHPGAQISHARSCWLPSRGGSFFGIASWGTGAWKWNFCLLLEPHTLPAPIPHPQLVLPSLIGHVVCSKMLLSQRPLEFYIG